MDIGACLVSVTDMVRWNYGYGRAEPLCVPCSSLHVVRFIRYGSSALVGVPWATSGMHSRFHGVHWGWYSRADLCV